MNQITETVLKDITKAIKRENKKRGCRRAVWIHRRKGNKQCNYHAEENSTTGDRKDLYVCFIDYEKAFDRVNHEAL